MTKRAFLLVLASTLSIALLLCGCQVGTASSVSSALPSASHTSSDASPVGDASQISSDASELTESASSALSGETSSQDEPPTPTVRPSAMSRLTAFYAPRQASCVYTVDAASLDRDTVDMLRTLQGLLARCDAASFYLIGDESDYFWRTYAGSEMGVYFRQTTVEQLIGQFADRIGGLILYSADTFEYETAFDLAFLTDAVIATEEVARRYGLAAYGRVTDLRGAYADRQAAYADVAARMTEPAEYYYLSGTARSFADYAYAVHAPMFCFTGEAWEASFLATLTEREGNPKPAVVFADSDAPALRDRLSMAGFGLLNVNGFANATFFSSVSSTRRYTPRQPTVNAPAPDGSVCVSFLLTSDSVGDALTVDYRVWSEQNGSIPVAYAFPVALCELAPMVTAWYNAACAGNSRLIARGWCDINEKIVSYDVYRKWHDVNNAMLSACGTAVSLTDALREDTIYGEDYGAFSLADGILVTDGSGDGSVWKSKNTPVIVTVNARSLPALDAWLASAAATYRPLYFDVAVSMSVFAQPYEILPEDPADEPTYLSFDDVVNGHVDEEGSPLRLLSVENLMEAGRR